MNRIPFGDRPQPRPVSTPLDLSYGAGLRLLPARSQRPQYAEALGADADGLAAADQRHRLSWWADRGLLPERAAPCSIAAAHVRLTGRQPARDPAHKTARAYNPLELLAALAELSRAATPPAPPAPPPPRALRLVPDRCPPAPLQDADPMAGIWRRALQVLQLPSTRMLLSQQARLLELRQSRYPEAPGELLALVEVMGIWLPMVASRRHLVAAALAEVLGPPVCVALIAAGGEL